MQEKELPTCKCQNMPIYTYCKNIPQYLCVVGRGGKQLFSACCLDTSFPIWSRIKLFSEHVHCSQIVECNPKKRLKGLDLDRRFRLARWALTVWKPASGTRSGDQICRANREYSESIVLSTLVKTRNSNEATVQIKAHSGIRNQETK